MPNKRDPNRDIDDFLGSLDVLQGLWDELFEALYGAQIPDATRERLLKQSCVDAFLRAAVAFENFRSDWHITAIHRDSRRFTSRIEERVRGKLSGDDLLKAASGYVTVKLPTHLSLAKVRGLVDPLGRNVSLKVTGKRTWTDRADEDLQEPYRSAVRNLPAAEWKLMGAVDALRNHLAHRSQDSVESMNAALAALETTKDGPLRRGPRKVQADGVPRYLWAHTQGNDGPCRLVVYYGRLRDVANALRVA